MPKADTPTESAPNAQEQSSLAQSTLLEADFHLIVIHPFGNYQKGACVKDITEITQIMTSENARFCNRINKPTE